MSALKSARAGGKGKAEEDDYREEFGFDEGKSFPLDQVSV